MIFICKTEHLIIALILPWWPWARSSPGVNQSICTGVNLATHIYTSCVSALCGTAWGYLSGHFAGRDINQYQTSCFWFVGITCACLQVHCGHHCIYSDSQKWMSHVILLFTEDEIHHLAIHTRNKKFTRVRGMKPTIRISFGIITYSPSLCVCLGGKRG